MDRLAATTLFTHIWSIKQIKVKEGARMIKVILSQLEKKRTIEQV